MLSPSLEDYLEEIYRLSGGSDSVRVTDVAATLNVKLPSVTRALQKLARKNYLTYQPYREVVLTPKGKKLGRFLNERNRVLQEFVRVLGSESDAAKEAEAMEHYLSLPTIRAIENLITFMHHYPECLNAFQEYREQRSKAGDGLRDGYAPEHE